MLRIPVKNSASLDWRAAMEFNVKFFQRARQSLPVWFSFLALDLPEEVFNKRNFDAFFFLIVAGKELAMEIVENRKICGYRLFSCHFPVERFRQVFLIEWNTKLGPCPMDMSTHRYPCPPVGTHGCAGVPVSTLGHPCPHRSHLCFPGA